MARFTPMVRLVPASASSTTTRPISGVPAPVTSLMTSVAMSAPTVPHTAPNTPASSQESTAPSAGGSGNTSR